MGITDPIVTAPTAMSAVMFAVVVDVEAGAPKTRSHAVLSLFETWAWAPGEIVFPKQVTFAVPALDMVKLKKGREEAAGTVNAITDAELQTSTTSQSDAVIV